MRMISSFIHSLLLMVQRELQQVDSFNSNFIVEERSNITSMASIVLHACIYIYINLKYKVVKMTP